MDVGGRGERGVKAMVRDSSHNIKVSVALSSGRQMPSSSSSHSLFSFL